MNPNYCHTITLYNCLKAGDNPEKKDVWYRTVLHDCFWKSRIVVEQGNTDDTEQNTAQANAYIVRIPQSSLYRAYREWRQLTSGQRKSYFTASEGDIVVHGECADEITGLTPDTASQVLLRNKPEAFRITAFSDNTSSRAAKHYRLGG